MPFSKEMRVERLEAIDMKNKTKNNRTDPRGKRLVRRLIELLSEGQNSTEVSEVKARIDRKFNRHSRNDEFSKLVNSNYNHHSDEICSSADVKNLVSKPVNGFSQPLYAQAGKERDNDNKLPSSQALALNGSPVATSAPVKRRKFFLSHREKFEPFSSDLPTTAKYLAHSVELSGKRNGTFLGKGRRTGEDSDESGIQSYLRALCEDEAKECGTLLTDVNERLHSQNGHVGNQSDPDAEATKTVVESEQHNRRKWTMSKSEVGSMGNLSGNVASGDFESTTNCEIVERTNGSSVSDVSVSTNKTSRDGCQSATNSYAVSPSLQPSVLLRRLTSDEIRHYTSKRGAAREEIPQCCSDKDESSDIESSDSENLFSLAKKMRKRSERKSYAREARFLKISPAPSGSRDKERSCEKEGNELHLSFEDRLEGCVTVVADVNERLNSQNVSVVNHSEPTTEATEVAVVNKEDSFVNSIKKWWALSALEVGCGDHLSGNVMAGDCVTATNCNSVGSEVRSPASQVSVSTNKTSRHDCKKARNSYTKSPMQPVVVLKRLTSDELSHCNSNGLVPTEAVSQNCVKKDERVGVESPGDLSFALSLFKRFYERKSYGREASPSKFTVASSEERVNGLLCLQDGKMSGSEGRLCESNCQIHAASSRQSGGSGHHRSNGEGGEEEIIRHTRVEDIVSGHRNDVASLSGCFSTSEVVGPDISTAGEASPFTMLACDKRKCCSNDVCRVATPELIGLQNPIGSNRCWMNVTLQTLFSMENFIHSMVRAFVDVNVEENSLLSCILTLYYARSIGHQECVYEQASKLVEALRTLNTDYVLNEQQDPSEFILWLFNTFEPALEKYGPSWASGLIAENFRFEMEERTICTGCLSLDANTSSFLILMLDIDVGTSKISTIEEALTAYTSTKAIGKTCSRCEADCSLVKTAFKSIPRYLIINLKRYSVEGGEVIRDETPVSHPLRLSLGKYSVPNSMGNCPRDRRSVAVSGPAKHNITRESLRRAAGDYDLISVIHHSGDSVSSGHYVCDVYHRRTDKWYSYNDAMVKEVNEMSLSSMKRQKTGYIYIYEYKDC